MFVFIAGHEDTASIGRKHHKHVLSCVRRDEDRDVNDPRETALDESRRGTADRVARYQADCISR